MAAGTRASSSGKAKQSGGASRAERRAILSESMRHLNEADVQKFAAQNGSIVAGDAHLNHAYVNDGAGGLKEASSLDEVLDYQDDRLRRAGQHRKLRDDAMVLQRYVVHLPKTMCVEVPDFYPRYDAEGNVRLDEDGNELSRSRWIARDPIEAEQYFRDAAEYLAEHVIPGGHAGIAGYATNHDESTPHLQLQADPFVEVIEDDSPVLNDAGEPVLRSAYTEAYSMDAPSRGRRRELAAAKKTGVAAPKATQRRRTGAEKMREYQAGLRQHMIDRGYPVELNAVGGTELTPAELGAIRDQQAEIEANKELAAQRLGEATASYQRGQDQAASILEDARREARQLVASAETEAGRIRAGAKTEAGRVDELVADAEQLVAEARADRDDAQVELAEIQLLRSQGRARVRDLATPSDDQIKMTTPNAMLLFLDHLDKRTNTVREKRGEPPLTTSLQDRYVAFARERYAAAQMAAEGSGTPIADFNTWAHRTRDEVLQEQQARAAKKGMTTAERMRRMRERADERARQRGDDDRGLSR